MSDIPYFSKYDFLALMEQKRGIHYTYGWLKSAYAMPNVTEAQEMEIIQKEIPKLEALPDYDGV